MSLQSYGAEFLDIESTLHSGTGLIWFWEIVPNFCEISHFLNSWLEVLKQFTPLLIRHEQSSFFLPYCHLTNGEISATNMSKLNELILETLNAPQVSYE